MEMDHDWTSFLNRESVHAVILPSLNEDCALMMALRYGKTNCDDSPMRNLEKPLEVD